MALGVTAVSLKDGIAALVKRSALRASTTMREARGLLAAELKVSAEELKAQKSLVADLILKTLDKTTEKQKPQKENAEEDPRLRRLKELARAMRLGPNVYRGLQNMEADDKVETLRTRLNAKLRDKGANQVHDLPTSRDIADAKARRQRDDDLDGVDTSNILSGSKRQRGGGGGGRGRVVVDENQVEKQESDNDNDEDSSDDDSSSSDDESSGDEEEDEGSSVKKAKKEATTMKEQKKIEKKPRRVPNQQADDSEEEFQF